MASRTIGNLNTKVTATDDGFSSTLNKQKAEAKAFKEEVEKPAKGGWGLSDLKSSFGRGSDLNQSMKILAGGGAIMGLTAVAKQLEDIGLSAQKWREELNSGAKTTGEVADEVMAKLPIIGSFWAAGHAIRDAISGAAEEEAKIKAQAKAIDLLNDATKARVALQKQLNEASEDYYRSISQRADVLGEHTPEQLDAIRRENALENETARFRREAAKELEKVKAEEDKATAEMQKPGVDPEGEKQTRLHNLYEQQRADIKATLAQRLLAANQIAGLEGIDATRKANDQANAALRAERVALVKEEHEADLAGMEAAGNAIDAEREKVRQAHEERLAQIQRERDEAIKAHGEHSGTYDEVMKQREEVENRRYMAQQAGIEEKHTAEETKKAEEAATAAAKERARLLSDANGPEAGYLDKIKELRKAWHDGVLDANDFKLATLAAAADYEKATQSRTAEAQTRRTTFTVRYEPGKDERAEKALREAQKQTGLLDAVNKSIQAALVGNVVQI